VEAHPAAASLRTCRAEMNHVDQAAAIRVDRWLWAARAFHSRALAAQACDGGKVSVNGAGAKPHKLVRPGDLLEITTPGGTRQWRVRTIGARRGPAAVARTLYDDLTPPPAPESPRALSMPRRARGSGRPTKRERRRLDRLW
jgi:ribosome-associated heat shock protein Hsp15